MRSTSGFFAAIAFLLVVPLALLSQLLFGSGADIVIHFVCGVGFALCALAVFDFRLPRWINWIGFVSASAAAIIFLLQGVSNLIPNDTLDYLAFQVLGQWPEGLSISILILWFTAMLFYDSQGSTRIFGFVVMSIILSLEVYRYGLAFLGGTPAAGLKLFYLLVFVWFLFESRKKISSKVIAAAA